MSTEHPLSPSLARIESVLLDIRARLDPNPAPPADPELAPHVRPWIHRYGDSWITSATAGDILGRSPVSAARLLARLSARPWTHDGRTYRIERRTRSGGAQWRVVAL